MNDNYVYARIGKGRKRHIFRKLLGMNHPFGASLCGMVCGGHSPFEIHDESDCAACLKKMERIRR